MKISKTAVILSVMLAVPLTAYADEIEMIPIDPYLSSSDDMMKRMDFNGDGAVDMKDVSVMLKVIADNGAGN